MEITPRRRPRTFAVLAFLAGVLLSTALTLHFIIYAEVSGVSMEPALHDGEKLVLVRSGEVDRGDYLLFPLPEAWSVYDPSKRGHTLIKRVLAGPGDKISWNGRVFSVNGSAAFTSADRPCAMGNFTATLRADQAFVAGDNGPVSIDSRRVMCDGSYGFLVDLDRGWKAGHYLFHF